MPKRTDIKKIMIVGSGPIVIGQACEFDYSGTQACRALRNEGFEVILVNSNPATIMTDPSIADRTYIEPLTWQFLHRIIEKERPQALLPTLGGQTALNLACDLHKMGILQMYGVELIGASFASIEKAEDRELFKRTLTAANLPYPKGLVVRTVDEGEAFVREIGFPVILRPSFTLGGSGGAVGYNKKELAEYLATALQESPVHEVLIEESLIGWKEIEFEVMRDRADNAVVVCAIENFDPMGVHTGDSITVCPCMTLTDKEYQQLRNYALAVIREIGVDAGGSNIQFAIHPKTGAIRIIEMNPRVSRSSALASKATGFPIAKISALLAVGYTLDEIPNDITKKTPSSFEPSIDYVVTKIPRFNFEKFPTADRTLNTQMKSIGEVMAIGGTFRESLLKAIESLETATIGLLPSKDIELLMKTRPLEELLQIPTPERLWVIAELLRKRLRSPREISRQTDIDLWFLMQIQEIVVLEEKLRTASTKSSEHLPKFLKLAKRTGFSDRYIAKLLSVTEASIREKRLFGPAYQIVDTCAAEFESETPYLYSTYTSTVSDLKPIFPDSASRTVLIIGSGPNRIGQGIEFDYCCVHASIALRNLGFEPIMVNSNPETVSTDYDVSSRLYFEPILLETVLEISRRERPMGIIVQFGGQTPLKLAADIERAGLRILGSSSETIFKAEDREAFANLLFDLDLRCPENGSAQNAATAIMIADKIGYPVIVRPSFVLGGRAMEVIYDSETLARYMADARTISEDRPIFIDRFLDNSIEIDVDAIADLFGDVEVIGIMEHVEEAGIHSGDSSCCLPPVTLPVEIIERIKKITVQIARELKVCGLMNLQLIYKHKQIWVLEVNPRASRTVPFVAKATGVPIISIATAVLLGGKLSDYRGHMAVRHPFFSVKEVVFPFHKFSNVDTLLGPEMKSTGEVMGVGKTFDEAYYKGLIAVGTILPKDGTVFVSVKDMDKPLILDLSRRLIQMNYTLIGTCGTAAYLRENGIPCQTIKKVKEGRPHVVDRIINREIRLVINTTLGKQSISDSFSIRRNTLVQKIPYFTSITAAKAAVAALEKMREQPFEIRALQDYL